MDYRDSILKFSLLVEELEDLDCAQGAEDPCLECFGRQLFGEILKRDFGVADAEVPDTDIERGFSHLLYAFVNGEFDKLRDSDISKEEVEEAFEALYQCREKEGYEILKNEYTGRLFRGTVVAEEKLSSNPGDWEQIDIKDEVPADPDLGHDAFTNEHKVYMFKKPIMYKSRSKVSSWTNWYNEAASFATSPDRGDDDKINAILMIDKADPKEYIFDREFIEKLNIPEGESIRITNNPVKVRVLLVEKDYKKLVGS